MRKGLLANIALCFVLSACKKADLGGISNLNNNEIQTIGHGGMGITSSYPINTYESLTAALSAGADGVELDVQMTKDSVLVAFHNVTMDENTSCTGMINDLTLAELKECRYVNEIFGIHRILILREMVTAWKDQGEKTIVFDCKLLTNFNRDTFLTAFADQLIQLIESMEGQHDVLIESQEAAFLGQIKVIKPNYKLFFYPEDFGYGLVVARAYGFYGLSIKSESVSEVQIEEAHAGGFRVAVWNIDSRKDNVAAINKSPDYIQTDKLKNLIKLLN
ncbi:MAG: hypothetical protein JKX73_03835 [Flavobacteriales bacterium]|nr:hypothetical protein [Flavobacteriales bacterium]